MNKQYIERELKDLAVGKSKMIAWECVTRWSDNIWEVQTWGKLYNNFDLAGAVDRLCQIRNIK